LSEEVVDQNADFVSDPADQNWRNIAPGVDWNCGGAAICVAELFVVILSGGSRQTQVVSG
jgi:hypothetical protein